MKEAFFNGNVYTLNDHDWELFQGFMFDFYYSEGVSEESVKDLEGWLEDRSKID